MDLVTILPPEVTGEIFSYLSLADLKICNEVSQSWRKFINDTRHGQRLALKNNWEQGTFKEYFLEGKIIIHDFDFCKMMMPQYMAQFRLFDVEVLPPKDPNGCFYYPTLVKACNMMEKDYDFYMLCIDADMKISSEILFTSNDFPPIYRACVMGDYVVWIRDKVVQCFCAKYDSGNRVKTIGTIASSKNNLDLDSKRYAFGRFLALDSHHIVAATFKTLKVWRKQTHEIILELDAPSTCSFICSFQDGWLVISTRTSRGDNSEIEIHNVRDKDNNSLKHKIVVDGDVTKVECSENSIVYTYEDSARRSNITVLDRKTFAVKFSTHALFDDYVFLKKVL